MVTLGSPRRQQLLEQQTQCVYLVLVNSHDEDPFSCRRFAIQEAALHEASHLLCRKLVDPVDVVVVVFQFRRRG